MILLQKHAKIRKPSTPNREGGFFICFCLIAVMRCSPRQTSQLPIDSRFIKSERPEMYTFINYLKWAYFTFVNV